MTWKSRNFAIRHAQRIGRLMATVVTLPVLVLSPLTAQALVIHDHHGHDTHGHTVTLRDLDDLRDHSEHRHEHHNHDGLPVDPAEDDSTPILILLASPEALTSARPSSACLAVATGIGAALRPLVLNGHLVDGVRPHVETQQTLAKIPRTRGLVTGILLTNHALLL